MDERQMSVDIIIAEKNDHRGAWVAIFYRGQDMDQIDESILARLTGTGATPFEAASNLFAMAAAAQERRGN